MIRTFGSGMNSENFKHVTLHLIGLLISKSCFQFLLLPRGRVIQILRTSFPFVSQYDLSDNSGLKRYNKYSGSHRGNRKACASTGVVSDLDGKAGYMNKTFHRGKMLQGC